MAAVKIIIPTPLRPYAGGNAAVEVSAETVAAALVALVGRYPELRQQLYGEQGRLRAFVNIYVNEEDIRHLQQESTPVKGGDSLSIVPSIAGGGMSL